MPYSNINITTQTNLSFVTGQYIQVIHNSSNYIVGQVVDYNSTPGLLVFTPITVVGSGTYTSWTIICSSSPGEQGTSGTSGTSGVNGTSGSSGTSGLNGTSGVSGTSGTSGVSGTSGTSGIDGTSGVSGTSGTSGVDGASGTSGVSGTSGTSGVDGTSGTSGTSGATGTSGAAGTSGTSGTSGSTPNPNARTETTFTATAGQTTFTVAYTVGQVDVYYNGSKLAPAEFTATTGTSIVLATACQENDIVDVLANITGGGVGGGGTTDYVPRFTGSTTLGNSSLQQVSTGWMQLGDSSVNTSVFEIQGNNGVQLGLYDGYAYNTIQTQNAYAFTILNQIGATSTSLMDYNYITKTLTFQTNGNNTRLNITSTGNVGIGNTNNTYKLDVTGTGYFSGDLTANGVTIGASDIRSSSNVLTIGGTSEVMRITGGNVGIGTSSPSYLLDVNGTSRFGSDTINGNMQIISNSQPLIIRGRSPYSAAGLLLTWDISPDTGVIAAPNLAFNTNATIGTNAGSERMRITSGGNVGIGTSSPSYTLDVTGTGRFTSSLIAASFSTPSTGLSGSTTWNFYHDQYAAGDFGLWAGGTNRILINAAGNVGIGTTSPSFSDFSTNTLGINISNQSTNYAGLKLTGNTAYTTGSFGLYSGSAAHYLWGGGANPMIFATNDAERMRITSGGKVLVNTTTTTAQNEMFTVRGEAAITYLTDVTRYRQLYYSGNDNFYFYNGSNNAYLSSAGAWTNASDITIKKEIEDLQYGLNEILSLKPRKYKMKSNNIIQIGFIAQEVEEILPELVDEDDKGMKGLSYGQMTAVLVKAIQEQQIQIEELKAKIK